MSAEVALSKESLQGEGIELKLTQSDIIEMLVEDQVRSITDIGDQLMENQKNILELMHKEWSDANEKQVAKITIPKGLTLVGHEKGHNGKERKELIQVKSYIDSRNGTISYSTGTLSINMVAKATISPIYRAEISKIELKGYGEKIDFNFKHSKKLNDFIDAHNTKVKEFIALVPTKGINEKEISKTIKNRLTKEMIKNMNPDLQKALKKGFGVTL